jgi:tetratricopeptide (TPR) repeat protein
MKIPDMFIRISTLIDKESTIYAAMEYLRNIRDRLRVLDLPEEEAKIMMVMGNLSFKIEDYESAAEYYEECADLYLKAEPQEYRSASAMFLIRAAECYEHLRYIHEKGERIMIQAALRVNKKAMDYQAEEFRGLKFIKLKKYGEAIPIYTELYNFFIEALDNLSSMIVDTPEIRSIAIFAKTRLIHIVSEYRLILMICYDRNGEKEKSKEIALEAIDHLNTGIEMIRSMILQGFWSKDDLKRLTYEGFMRAYFQKYWHIKNPTPDQQIHYYILYGLGGEPAEQIKKLPYYDLCVKTETYNLEQLDELLYGFNLGRLDKYKEIFMKKSVK